MFDKFIKLMEDKKTYSQFELAKELGVSLETLHLFIEFLASYGIIAQIEYPQEKISCSGGCKGCPGCKTGNTTEKQLQRNKTTLWCLEKD